MFPRTAGLLPGPTRRHHEHQKNRLSAGGSGQGPGDPLAGVHGPSAPGAGTATPYPFPGSRVRGNPRNFEVASGTECPSNGRLAQQSEHSLRHRNHGLRFFMGMPCMSGVIRPIFQGNGPVVRPCDRTRTRADPAGIGIAGGAKAKSRRAVLPFGSECSSVRERWKALKQRRKFSLHQSEKGSDRAEVRSLFSIGPLLLVPRLTADRFDQVSAAGHCALPAAKHRSKGVPSLESL